MLSIEFFPDENWDSNGHKCIGFPHVKSGVLMRIINGH
jgi:hypothetical protein